MYVTYMYTTSPNYCGVTKVHVGLMSLSITILLYLCFSVG